MINATRVVKLGDFGMTRSMFDKDYYKFTRKGKVLKYYYKCYS